MPQQLDRQQCRQRFGVQAPAQPASPQLGQECQADLLEARVVRADHRQDLNSVRVHLKLRCHRVEQPSVQEQVKVPHLALTGKLPHIKEVLDRMEGRVKEKIQVEAAGAGCIVFHVPAPRVLGELPPRAFPRLRVLWGDRKYRNDAPDAYRAGRPGLRVEVRERPEGVAGFTPVRKRWVVEQAFGCLMRSRRLARDYERLPECSAAMVKVSAIHRLLRRLRPAPQKYRFRYKRPRPRRAA